jgi:hypothetical protein
VTLCDETWNTALEQVNRTGCFKIGDLPFKESERHTVRRCLREMESYSWLSRDSPHSSIWRAGPKSEMLFDLSEEKLRLARS